MKPSSTTTKTWWQFSRRLSVETPVVQYPADYFIYSPAITSTMAVNTTNIYVLGHLGLQRARNLRGPLLFTQEMGLTPHDVDFFKHIIGTKKKYKFVFYYSFFFFSDRIKARKLQESSVETITLPVEGNACDNKARKLQESSVETIALPTSDKKSSKTRRIYSSDEKISKTRRTVHCHVAARGWMQL